MDIVDSYNGGSEITILYYSVLHSESGFLVVGNTSALGVHRLLFSLQTTCIYFGKYINYQPVKVNEFGLRQQICYNSEKLRLARAAGSWGLVFVVQRFAAKYS